MPEVHEDVQTQAAETDVRVVCNNAVGDKTWLRDERADYHREGEKTSTLAQHDAPAGAAVQALAEDIDTCTICLEEYTFDDPAIRTCCGHAFHLQCIMQWAQRSRECPLCFNTLALQDDSLNELLPFGEATTAPRSASAPGLLIALEPWEVYNLMGRLSSQQQGARASVIEALTARQTARSSSSSRYRSLSSRFLRQHASTSPSAASTAQQPVQQSASVCTGSQTVAQPSGDALLSASAPTPSFIGTAVPAVHATESIQDMQLRCPPAPSQAAALETRLLNSLGEEDALAGALPTASSSDTVSAATPTSACDSPAAMEQYLAAQLLEQLQLSGQGHGNGSPQAGVGDPAGGAGMCALSAGAIASHSTGSHSPSGASSQLIQQLQGMPVTARSSLLARCKDTLSRTRRALSRQSSHAAPGASPSQDF